jgi:hypothetical protein
MVAPRKTDYSRLRGDIRSSRLKKSTNATTATTNAAANANPIIILSTIRATAAATSAEKAALLRTSERSGTWEGRCFIMAQV